MKSRFYFLFLILSFGLLAWADRPEFDMNQCQSNCKTKLGKSKEWCDGWCTLMHVDYNEQNTAKSDPPKKLQLVNEQCKNDCLLKYSDEQLCNKQCSR